MSDAVCMTQDYNQKGQLQRSSSDSCLPLLKSRVKAMHEINPERFHDTATPFTIADLGCATGLSSINPCKTLIDAVREINPAMPIIIHLVDLPKNYFTTAILTVSEGLKDYKDIYIYCIGKSIYRKLFPENSIDFMYSFSTLHWIEEVPPSSKEIIYALTDENLETEEGQKWSATAKEHWKKFLSLREAELRTAGQIVTSTPGFNQEMTLANKKGHLMLITVREALEKTLEKYDLAHLNENMAVPAVKRRESDWTDIFKEGNEMKLKLTHYEYQETRFPFVTQYYQDYDHEKMVEGFRDFIKGWSFHCVQGTLERFMVDKTVAEKILDDFYGSELKMALSEWAAQSPPNGDGYNIMTLSK